MVLIPGPEGTPVVHGLGFSLLYHTHVNTEKAVNQLNSSVRCVGIWENSKLCRAGCPPGPRLRTLTILMNCRCLNILAMWIVSKLFKNDKHFYHIQNQDKYKIYKLATVESLISYLFMYNCWSIFWSYPFATHYEMLWIKMRCLFMQIHPCCEIDPVSQIRFICIHDWYECCRGLAARWPDCASLLLLWVYRTLLRFLIDVSTVVQRGW